MAAQWERGFQGLHPLFKFNEISKSIQAYTVNKAVPEDGVVLLLTFRPAWSHYIENDNVDGTVG